MNKRSGLLCAVVMLLALLSGCGQQGGQTAKAKREQVTVALWSDQLTENYAEYLQDTFPEVEFIFYVATNSADFYQFKQKQGDLPDILTVRRFALRDVADWKDELMDLSDTELVNMFSQVYLRSYTYSDGTLNWLPTCAEADGIIVNRVLLEENGLAVPENYGQFVELCKKLQEKGIRPFLSNFSMDYTCMEILQGLSVELLTSQNGREWRQQYESGKTNRLSEEIWLPVFERMEEFIGYTGINAKDMEMEHTDVLESFVCNELAMMRGTGNETAIRNSVDGEYLLLPYFGESEENNWYLTYPSFQTAAKATDDPERKELILDILTAMLNQDGLKHIASGRNMVPYSKGVEIALSPELANMQPYIDSNRLYIRLASSEMFSISKAVVQGMITGEYPDARSAFDAFNRAMERGREEESAAVVHIDTAYPYAFDPETGSQAASAIMNSVREEVGTQFLIGSGTAVAGNISAGDYRLSELSFLTMGESPVIMLCEMTGDQMYRYIEYVLTNRGKYGAVINDSSLYVSSGLVMDIRKTDAGYVLEKLTADGQELNREERYSVAILGSMSTILQSELENLGVEEYAQSETVYKQIVTERLAGGRQLAAPTKYITLH